MPSKLASNPAIKTAALMIAAVVDLLLLPVLASMAVATSFTRRRRRQPPRLVWGSTPLINNVYWSRAMKEAGFVSETFMFNFYSISKREDFDRILLEEYRWCPIPFRPYLGFISALIRYDVVVTSFSGFMLVTPILKRMQAGLFRLAAIWWRRICLSTSTFNRCFAGSSAFISSGRAYAAQDCT